MKCEEFRNQFDAAPGDEFAGRDQHLQSCDACMTHADKALAFDTAFEATVLQALKVDVPDFAMPALEPIASNVVGIDRAKPRRLAARSSLWLAAAASVTLAVVIGTQVLKPPVPSAADEALASEIMAHMVGEDFAQVVSTQAVPAERIQQVTNASNTDVDDALGLISYARSCEINGHSVPHLVVQGESGPVTIMIMPNEDVNAPVKLDNDDYHGAILPVGDNGSVAIIGRKGESINDIRERVRDTIRLSI